MKKIFFLTILFYLLPNSGYSQEEITLPLSGSFVTDDTVSVFKNFKTAKRKELVFGGYNTSDSMFGKMLYFSGGYIKFQKICVDTLRALSTNFFVLANNKHIASTNEFPKDDPRNFTQNARKTFYDRPRLQLVDPNMLIRYSITETHEDYSDMIFYKYKGAWLYLMPIGVTDTKINISEKGRVTLTGKIGGIKKIFFLLFNKNENCYFWADITPEKNVTNN